MEEEEVAEDLVCSSFFSWAFFFSANTAAHELLFLPAALDFDGNGAGFKLSFEGCFLPLSLLLCCLCCKDLPPLLLLLLNLALDLDCLWCEWCWFIREGESSGSKCEAACCCCCCCWWEPLWDWWSICDAGFSFLDGFLTSSHFVTAPVVILSIIVSRSSYSRTKSIKSSFVQSGNSSVSVSSLNLVSESSFFELEFLLNCDIFYSSFCYTVFFELWNGRISFRVEWY